MRAASAALIAHLAGKSRTMAYLWRVVRTDGEIFGFTNHDADLTLDDDLLSEGLTYVADLGVNASTVQSTVGLSVDNLDVTGFLSSGTLTAVDVAAGLWDHAEVRLMECNWADLTMGVMKTKRGHIGEVTVTDTGYSAEFRSLSAALNSTIGEVTGPGCTAQLGDVRCKVSLSDYTTTGTVTSADSDTSPERVFDTDLSSAIVALTPDTTGAPDDAYFNDGLLTWDTGPNAGLEMDIKRYTVDGRIELHLPMPNEILPGDTFTAIAGCNKSLTMCSVRFDNVVNFRGFPFLPGLDATMKTPGQNQPTE